MHIVIFLVIIGCLLYTFGVARVTMFALGTAAAVAATMVMFGAFLSMTGSL